MRKHWSYKHSLKLLSKDLEETYLDILREERVEYLKRRIGIKVGLGVSWLEKDRVNRYACFFKNPEFGKLIYQEKKNLLCVSVNPLLSVHVSLTWKVTLLRCKCSEKN